MELVLTTITDNAAMLVLLAVLSLLVIPYLLSRHSSSREGRLPAGPSSLPLIGNIHQIILSGSMDSFMEKYRKIYGNVFTVETGGSKRVIVSSYEVFRELLIKNGGITSTRDTLGLTKYLQKVYKQEPGLFFAPHPHWKPLRTFALQCLREDGMGRSALEPQIVQEIDHYINHFIEPNMPIDMTISLPQATCNIISQLLFCRRFDYDDEEFNAIINALNVATKRAIFMGLLTNIPFNNVILDLIYGSHQKKVRDVVLNGIKKLIGQQKENLVRENPQGLLENYLIHAETEEGKDNYCLSENNCVRVITHLYGAGTETTSTALKFCLLYMCTKQHIQNKVHQEIDEIIGSRQVAYKDRTSLPYVEAVLLENFRISNIVPSALPHTLEEDLVVDGTLIPGGSDLLLNMASVLHDETVFDEPKQFKPQRYLEGDIALKKHRTIPFSLGRRNCLGESLAKVEMFMFFVTFMQRYSVRLPEGSTADPSHVTSDIVRAPRPYKIIFTPRERS